MTHAKTSAVCLGAGRGGQVSVERLLIRALHECYRPISYPGCNGDLSHMRRGCALKLRSCLVSQSKRGTPVKSRARSKPATGRQHGGDRRGLLLGRRSGGPAPQRGWATQTWLPTRTQDVRAGSRVALQHLRQAGDIQAARRWSAAFGLRSVVEGGAADLLRRCLVDILLLLCRAQRIN